MSRERDRDLVAEALRRAAPDDAPCVEVLVRAVPSMLLASRERRREAARPGVQLNLAARAWLPRLAAATAILVLAALLWPAAPGATPGTQADALDRWLATGASPSGVEDPVLDALVR